MVTPSEAAVRLIWPESRVFQHTPETLAELGRKLALAYELDLRKAVRAHLKELLRARATKMLDLSTGQEETVVYLGDHHYVWRDLCRELDLD